jgi:hypothetical protein
MIFKLYKWYDWIITIIMVVVIVYILNLPLGGMFLHFNTPQDAATYIDVKNGYQLSSNGEYAIIIGRTSDNSKNLSYLIKEKRGWHIVNDCIWSTTKLDPMLLDPSNLQSEIGVEIVKYFSLGSHYNAVIIEGGSNLQSVRNAQNKNFIQIESKDPDNNTDEFSYYAIYHQLPDHFSVYINNTLYTL